MHDPTRPPHRPDPALVTRVQRALAPLGWRVRDGAAIASRYVDTAVGPREAFIYLGWWNADGCTLLAEYWSEGNDCLSCVVTPLARAADDATLARTVADHCAGIDHAIDRTYARGLLLRHPDSFADRPRL